MDDAQNCDSYNNVLSSQTLRSYLQLTRYVKLKKKKKEIAMNS
jgi:hypothetical protein